MKMKRARKALPSYPVCGAPIKRVPFEEMGFKSDEHIGNLTLTKSDYYWTCKRYPACNTYVRANKYTGLPTGTIAWPSLRYTRTVLLQCVDTIFKAGAIDNKNTFWTGSS